MQLSLTPATRLTQLQAIKSWVIANAGGVFDAGTAALMNAVASPDFWVWKSNLNSSDSGMAINLNEVGGLTTANSTRLQVSFQIRPGGFTPAVQADRALFGSVFSAAGGVNTRAALLAKWQKLATIGEKLLASGTGTQATGLNTDGTVTGGSPATFGDGAEGQITTANLIEADGVIL